MKIIIKIIIIILIIIIIIPLIGKTFLKCDEYRYDNCPKLCTKKCKSSKTIYEKIGEFRIPISTHDCNGAGSCRYPYIFLLNLGKNIK